MRSNIRTFRFLICVPALLLTASWAGRSVFSQTSLQSKSTNNICTSQPATDTTNSKHTGAINPHGSADTCSQCHKMAGDKAEPIAIQDIDAVCLKCHNGKDAKAEAHPIGRTFAAKDLVQPEGWPTPNGKLGCITCHKTNLRSKDNPAFIRGYKKGQMI